MKYIREYLEELIKYISLTYDYVFKLVNRFNLRRK